MKKLNQLEKSVLQTAKMYPNLQTKLFSHLSSQKIIAQVSNECLLDRFHTGFISITIITTLILFWNGAALWYTRKSEDNLWKLSSHSTMCILGIQLGWDLAGVFTHRANWSTLNPRNSKEQPSCLYRFIHLLSYTFHILLQVYPWHHWQTCLCCLRKHLDKYKPLSKFKKPNSSSMFRNATWCKTPVLIQTSMVHWQGFVWLVLKFFTFNELQNYYKALP